MHGTIGSYNISAFWYLPKYANRWNKHSKWRSMDWARYLLLIIENSQQISTRPGSALYRSIHSNRRLAIYRTLPHYRHSQLTSIWPIPNLEGASARLGSVRPLKPVTPEHTSRLSWHTGSSQRPSTRRHCSTPLHEVDCQDALMASQWMPISLLNVIRLVVEQGFCNHRSSALRLHATRHPSCICRITKRTKTNTDLDSTIESEGHTYLLECSPKSLPATQLPWTSR